MDTATRPQIRQPAPPMEGRMQSHSEFNFSPAPASWETSPLNQVLLPFTDQVPGDGGRRASNRAASRRKPSHVPDVTLHLLQAPAGRPHIWNHFRQEKHRTELPLL